MSRIGVIGIGDAGNSSIHALVQEHIDGIQLVAINTNQHALIQYEADTHLLIGQHGLGAGGIPENGRQAAKLHRSEIEEILHTLDHVFVVAGLGGGTGSGAAPEVAQFALSNNLRVTIIVSMPFGFEGQQRQQIASDAYERLKQLSTDLVVIPGDHLIRLTIKNNMRHLFDLMGKSLAWTVLAKILRE